LAGTDTNENTAKVHDTTQKAKHPHSSTRVLFTKTEQVRQLLNFTEAYRQTQMHKGHPNGAGYNKLQRTKCLVDTCDNCPENASIGIYCTHFVEIFTYVTLLAKKYYQQTI